MKSADKLENLTRMLTGNFGKTEAVFDEQMIAEALEFIAENHFDDEIRTAPHVVQSFLRSLSDAFKGVGQPLAKLKAGRKGKRSQPVTALGVSQRALDILDYLDDPSNLERVNMRKESLIEEIAQGQAKFSNGEKVANGDRMHRSTVMEDYKKAKQAKDSVRSRFSNWKSA